MKKRFMALFMILALCLSSFVGCNKKGEDNSAQETTASEQTTSTEETAVTEAPASTEQVTIRTTLQAGEFTDDQIKEFESQNPNIKIERVIADDTKLMAMIAAGTAPDLIRILGVQQLPTYISRGLALNIDEYIQNSTVIKKDDFLPVVNVYRFDGQNMGSGELYGLPKDWSLDNTIFINKKLFADAGVPLPDPTKPLTYSELYDLANKLTKMNGDNVEITGLDGADTLFTLVSIQSMMQQIGKPLWSDDFKTVNIDNDDVKAAFNKINDMVQAKACYSPISPNPSGWFGPAFIEGKVAILQTGYWFSGMLRSDPLTKDNLDNYMMLPAPVMEGGNRMSVCTSATGCIILKQTEHPEEAFKVFEFYFGGKPAEERAKGGFGLPITKSMMEFMPQASDFDKQCYDVTMDEIENGDSGKVLLFNPYINSAAVTSLIDKLISPIYFDTATVDESFAELQKQIELLVSEGMDISGVK